MEVSDSAAKSTPLDNWPSDHAGGATAEAAEAGLLLRLLLLSPLPFAAVATSTVPAHGVKNVQSGPPWSAAVTAPPAAEAPTPAGPPAAAQPLLGAT